MLSTKTKVKVHLNDGLTITGTIYNYSEIGIDITDEKGKRVFMPWFSVNKVVEETEASW